MSKQVERRLTNAMRQLRQEFEASGDEMPDCEFVVRVRDGQVEIEEIHPTPQSPPRIQGGEANAVIDEQENSPAPAAKSRTAKKRG